MSFIAYLCWLLGVSAPSDCDANSYEAWLSDSCAPVDETNVETSPKDEGQRNDAAHHARGTSNISVSI
jgi:hypothetical protein